MKMSRVILFVCFFAQLAFALPTFAQEATPEATPSPDLQTFTTENGLASVQYPTGWVFTNSSDEDNLISLNLANSDGALHKDLFNKDDVFNSGEVHIEVETISLPKLVTLMPAGTLTLDATPLQVVQALASQGLPDTFTFGDPGELTINGLSAVRMNLNASNRGEGQLLIAILDKKWVAALILYAAPGESDKWDIIARNILSSITINPDANPNPQPTEVPNTVPTPPIESTAAPLPTRSYTSEKGKFTIAYPADLQFDDESTDNSDGFVGGFFYSTQSAKTKTLKDDYHAGELTIEFAVLTAKNLTALFGASTRLKIDASTTPASFLQTLLAETSQSGVHYGAVQQVPIDYGTLAQVDVSGTANNEGHVYVIKRSSDGKYMLMMIYAAPNELESGEAAALSVAASLTFDTAQTPTEASTPDLFALTQTAKTQNGLGSVSYPETWVSRQSGARSVYLANNASALNKSFGSAIASGEVNLLVSMSSTDDYIQEAKLPVQSDATPLELLQSTIKLVNDSTIKFGMPEAAQVGDKVAARVHFAGANFEGTAWLIEYQKGATIALQMLTAPGESQQWEALALTIAQSIRSTD